MPSSINRMALHRARKKRGLRYLGIELRETEISELGRRGLVVEQDRNNGTAIRDALYRFFDKNLTVHEGSL